MASLIFNSGLADAFTGAINFAVDTFGCMLVTEDYAPDKKLHTKRSDVTNEVSGDGYNPGGNVVTVTVTKNNPANRIDVELGGSQWLPSTITARGCVYFKKTGGPAADDPLVVYIDFNKDIISTDGLFNVSPSILRLSNPDPDP